VRIINWSSPLKLDGDFFSFSALAVAEKRRSEPWLEEAIAKRRSSTF
jgi:hypothetical protein